MLIRALQGAALAQTNYIEDVFSTYLYTGNGSTQTITNGIDLTTKGGLVWIKERNSTGFHRLLDTLRGVNRPLFSNATNASPTQTELQTFNSDGFTVTGANTNNTFNYVSWTLARQPKFFDVVTWTGNNVNNRAITHSLESVPGCIIVKCTSSSQYWRVYHRSLSSGTILELDATFAAFSSSEFPTNPDATNFYLSTSIGVNASGETYVAYLFAHDAGGFGDSGTDNVISCGSFTTDGSGNATVTLGYEPQWILYKRTDSTSDWPMHDTMRGWVDSGSIGAAGDVQLLANLSDAETTGLARGHPTATGFTMSAGNSATYIYIAIRRGPMRKPTSGTSVFTPIARNGNGTATTVTGVGFAPDLVFEAPRTNSGGNNWVWFDRLRGGAAGLSSDNTGAEFINNVVIQSDSLSTTMDGFRIQTANPINASGNTYVYYPIRRAPGFFDVVCYTGTGSATTVSHNLGVVPELMITKGRSSLTNWRTFYSFGSTSCQRLLLNGTNAAANETYAGGDGFSATPTQTALPLAAGGFLNVSAETYVAYLFATCPGVSKVGSYTGTGATLQIDCGFAAGARFVLIKRTDSAGDWYVWDSARGIVAGTEPYLLLNSTAAEVTTTDWVDTYSLGFELSNAGGNNANINTASYIYLAIA